MNRNDAEKIAKQHLDAMNPDRWDGKHKKPNTFDLRIVTYPLSNDMELDISFEKERNPDTQESEWTHYCELRDVTSGDCVIPMHGYGIDSINNLTDTIEDVCVGYEIQEK